MSMGSLSEVTVAAQGLCLGGFIVNRLALTRQRTHTGQPLVNAEFIQSLEKAVQRRLTLQNEVPTEKSYRSKTR